MYFFCQAVCGYFDAMEAKTDNIDGLIDQYKHDFETLAEAAPPEALNIYIRPLKGMMLTLKDDFKMEKAERIKQADACDLMVCGALTDEWRTGRYQHGSKTVVYNNRLGREVGNRVFPNGFITGSLTPDSGNMTLRIEGAADVSKQFKLTVNGNVLVADFDDNGVFSMQLAKTNEVEIKIEKSGAEYPIIHTIALYS